MKENLQKQEKETLLKLARKTLTEYLENNKNPKLDDFKITEGLKKKQGVFVTLKIDDMLRGCIGYVVGIKPLYEGVIENTINAAVNDPRFTPVQKNEVDKIDIEISAMTPLEKIDNPNIVEVGKHGLVIKKGFSSGLLLPQVAPEQGWNREEFLSNTCRKAGLPGDCWKEKDTEIYIFSAEVFGERHK